MATLPVLPVFPIDIDIGFSDTSDGIANAYERTPMTALETAPKPHENAEMLLARIAAEAPGQAEWTDNTRGRPECETLLNFARVHFRAKPNHDVAPGDVLVFRVSDGEAARTTGVMGADNFFTYEIPGRDGLQVNYLGHFWRTRLVGAFTVPERFLNRPRECVHVSEHFQAKWEPVRVKEMRPNKNLEPVRDSVKTGTALAAE